MVKSWLILGQLWPKTLIDIKKKLIKPKQKWNKQNQYERVRKITIVPSLYKFVIQILLLFFEVIYFFSKSIQKKFGHILNTQQPPFLV